MPLDVEGIVLEEVYKQLPPALYPDFQHRLEVSSDADVREWLAGKGVILRRSKDGPQIILTKSERYLFRKEPGQEAKRTPQTPSALAAAKPKAARKTKKEKAG